MGCASNSASTALSSTHWSCTNLLVKRPAGPLRLLPPCTAQALQHLLNLRGNGTLMTMPEDDKTWMSIESRYHSLEFDYAPTPEQVRAYSLPTRNHGSWSGNCSNPQATIGKLGS